MKKANHRAANQGSKKKEQSEWLQEFLTNCDEEQQPQVPVPTSRVYDLRANYHVDSFVMKSWKEWEPVWLDEPLRTDLRDMFRGLERRIALEVIVCLTNYILWGIRDFTGLWHIDAMLRKAYNKIAYFVEKNCIEFPEYHS